MKRRRKISFLMASPHAFFPFLRARKVGGMAGGVVSWVNFLLLVLPFFASFPKISRETNTDATSRSPSAELLSRRRWRVLDTQSPLHQLNLVAERREEKHSSEKLSVLGENMVKIYGFKLRLENTSKKKETQENPMRWHDVVTHTTKCRK